MQGLVYATLCDGPHPQVVKNYQSGASHGDINETLPESTQLNHGYQIWVVPLGVVVTESSAARELA